MITVAAAGYGMRLEYLGRTAYRHNDDEALIAWLPRRFGRFCLLPEGGSNALGCGEIPAEISRPFDVICCPCGTGGTLAGLAHGLTAGQQAPGFPVLRGPAPPWQPSSPVNPASAMSVVRASFSSFHGCRRPGWRGSLGRAHVWAWPGARGCRWPGEPMAISAGNSNQDPGA
jgi:hypothetical protein